MKIKRSVERIIVRIQYLRSYGLYRWLKANYKGLTIYLRYKKLPTPSTKTFSKTILVVDDTLLRPDDSTLGRSNHQYVTLLRSLGWRVLLWPDNTKWDGSPEARQSTQWDEPYALQLEKAGVGVLAGYFFRRQRKQWLQANAVKIDYVLFRWPDQADAYRKLLQNHSQVKQLFMAMDLQALRKEREYAITGDSATYLAAQQFSELEGRVFQHADALLTYSQEEATWLRDGYGDKVFALPIFIFEQLAQPRSAAPANQQLLFVGNFHHPPNVDGLCWFVRECLPQIALHCPQVQLIIVGALMRPEILALQSVQITVLGKITDTELAAQYQQARVVIAPLRFGAGVKGKVIEALAHGVPVVTTRFGVEGVPGLEQIIPPVDTPEAITAAIIRLQTDDAEWQRVSIAGQEFVQQHFSRQTSQASIKRVFTWLEEQSG